ncbi:hypothetical protein P43SY_005473 [Pythium insidiosum]|uniref:Sphingomyelin synthase-like domain-containing protein n=1 Tax=Pythium insidiosum TaxID=114742 RepID=A0AAD5QAN4_PYTIN|nr:hypothetical protein P43SY_005473 [Pythium insidiosum]
MWPRWEIRDREAFVKYVKIELQLLAKEWKILLPCVIMQYVHGVFHNLAYWIQENKLELIQRYTLYDLGFELMPELSETDAHWSEYLVFGGVFAPAILLVLSVPIFKQNPKHPRYMTIILKRVLLHISVALSFRIASFLLTALPGPARHCRLLFDETCRQNNPNDPLKCVIDNPEFSAPRGHALFTHLDALNGCGDLMFSSHTIYTLSFILTVSKYWPSKYLVGLMVSIQIAIAFLIVAARKHYSLDVFTALYVVPLLWFFQEAYYFDINNRSVQISAKTIQEFYGVDVSDDVDPQPASIELESVQVTTEDTVHDPPSSMDGSSNAPFQRKNSM